MTDIELQYAHCTTSSIHSYGLPCKLKTIISKVGLISFEEENCEYIPWTKPRSLDQEENTIYPEKIKYIYFCLKHKKNSKERHFHIYEGLWVSVNRAIR